MLSCWNNFRQRKRSLRVLSSWSVQVKCHLHSSEHRGGEMAWRRMSLQETEKCSLGSHQRGINFVKCKRKQTEIQLIFRKTERLIKSGGASSSVVLFSEVEKVTLVLQDRLQLKFIEADDDTNTQFEVSHGNVLSDIVLSSIILAIPQKTKQFRPPLIYSLSIEIHSSEFIND